MAAMLALYQYTHEMVPDVGPETGIDPWVLNRRIRNL